jgi:hypothetical protein
MCSVVIATIFKPCFGHNFGTAQDIDMIQTPISFFFQALSDGLTFS